MNRFLILSFVFALVVCVVSSTLACGSANPSGGQLQAITIHSTVNGQQIRFTATGTFSALPTTVDPLPVDWSFGPFAPPPPGNLQYTLTTQPYLLNCGTAGIKGPAVLSALAPKNPGTSMEGSMPFAQLVTANAEFTCP
jgi:hypothetical protein